MAREVWVKTWDKEKAELARLLLEVDACDLHAIADRLVTTIRNQKMFDAQKPVVHALRAAAKAKSMGAK